MSHLSFPASRGTRFQTARLLARFRFWLHCHERLEHTAGPGALSGLRGKIHPSVPIAASLTSGPITMRSGPQVALARNVSVYSCVSSDYLSLSLVSFCDLAQCY